MVKVELPQEYLCGLCEERVRAFEGGCTLSDHCTECNAERRVQRIGEDLADALDHLDTMTTYEIQCQIELLLHKAVKQPRSVFYAASAVPWLHDIAALYA